MIFLQKFAQKRQSEMIHEKNTHAPACSRPAVYERVRARARVCICGLRPTPLARTSALSKGARRTMMIFLREFAEKINNEKNSCAGL